MQRRMVYSVDVGLQIGGACIGATLDGRQHVGVYLYPEPMTGTHLTYHMEDGTTGSKTDIAPTTEEMLWASVHNLSHANRSSRSTVHTVLTTTHTSEDDAELCTTQ